LNMLCKHSVSYIPRNITFNKKRAGWRFWVNCNN
jgi:hypothetical protein